MDKEQLKKYIYEYVKEYKEIPIYQLEDLFKEMNHDYIGRTSVTHDKDENIVFWIGWNQEAFDVIAELKKDRRIEMDICEPIVYMVDGKGLDLPIVRSKNIKTDHWLPVTFTISKKETECV
ncbi:TPA: pathogenicity island protein [Staphylococcus aureus]|nr:pathogenicity island protein [Staphylococcus aureus]